MLNHLHLLGKAFLKNPPRDVDHFNDWMKTLVEKIEMVILMGPYSIDCKTLGNEGITGAVVIETSHCTAHIWHAVDRPFMMMDCYSCVAFDPAVVLQHIDDHFEIDTVDYAFFDRNDGVKLIEQKSITWPDKSNL